MFAKLIRSPLNYTGNKYRILEQMVSYFPKNIDTMVDLFCGGATVGINCQAKKVIFIDNNPRVIGLLKFFAKKDFAKIRENLFAIVDQYHLSLSAVNGYKFYRLQVEGNPNNGLKEYNRKGFYALRDDYNKMDDKDTDRANLMLYVLMVYAFNNDMRFSKNGQFNLPVGKTDLNRNNLRKLEDYILRSKELECEFICGDFSEEKIKDIIKKADFIYMDPPYLITNAVYNENGGWKEEQEYQLLDLIDSFIADNKQFVLSNVHEKRNRRNEPLAYWIAKRTNHIEVVDINYHYRSASYNKKMRDGQEREIIIVPKRVGEFND